jgi:hypothetical protein
MKHYGMKTRGIYLIPLIGAAAALAVTADLWIFVILIPLGLLDYLYDRHQVTQAPRRARRRAGRHARMPEASTTPAADLPNGQLGGQP